MDIQDKMILSMIQGFSLSYFLYTSCELGIFETLLNEDQTLSELSERLYIRKDILLRLMNTLEAFGFVKIHDEKYSLQQLGKRLSEKNGKVMRELLLFSGRQCMPYWAKLYEAVHSGEAPYKLIEKQAYFDMQETNYQNYRTFNSMMSSNSEDLDLQPYFETEITPFRIKRIVDIGGGTGNILIKLLKFYKNSFGILLDLQFVETEAIRNLQNYNMENRVKFYSGNFFEPIDFSADIFVMSRILHDWSDEEAIQILKNVAQAMTENSRILIIEKIMPETPKRENTEMYMADLNMWVMCGGKERTLEEFKNLLQLSDLKVTRIIKLAGNESVLEVKKYIINYQEGMI